MTKKFAILALMAAGLWTSQSRANADVFQVVDVRSRHITAKVRSLQVEARTPFRNTVNRIVSIAN